MERIPFAETRNYVQRVMENLQVYRARFGASTATVGPNLHRAATIESLHPTDKSSVHRRWPPPRRRSASRARISPADAALDEQLLHEFPAVQH